MHLKKLVIDKKQYKWDPEGALFLAGWFAVDRREAAYVEVIDEEENPVAFERKFWSRPDVKNAYPELAAECSVTGFEITIPQLQHFISLHQQLTVLLKADTSRYTLFSRTSAQMKKEFDDSSLLFHLDTCTYSAKEIIMQGWIVDITGESFPEFTDENGTALPVQAKRSLRKDVANALGLESYYQDHAWGFSFTMPRRDLHGKKVLMKMQNPYISKSYRLSLDRPVWLNFLTDHFRPSVLRRRLSRVKSELKTRGVRGFCSYIWNEKLFSQSAYKNWLKKHRADRKELRRERKTHFPYEPLLSIVIPLYNTPPNFLKELIDSILGQSYANFEICFADGSTNPDASNLIKKHYQQDERIHLLTLEENRGISENTNAAIRMARGEFLLFSDHDDFLERNALYEMVSLLNQNPNLDIIYSDEDLTDAKGKKFHSPRFKPDFNPDLLRSINYICHLTMVRTSLVKKVGLLRKECDGAQDYDLLLRCIEQTDQVGHIPKVLYHWRAHGDSTAGNQDSKQYAIDAGELALREHLTRLGYEPEIEYSGIFILYRWKLKLQSAPLVTILIPNKDHTDILDNCVQSVYEKTDYPNYEIVVVENNSEKPETFKYYSRTTAEHENFRVVNYEGEFNYSAVNNFGARCARGEYILFLNNDTEVITPSWLRDMLGFCQRKDTAAVGAKLYYADDTVQHAGVVIGIGNFAGHVHSFSARHDSGYLGRLQAVQDISAVTAACIMVKRSAFVQAGGFDEDFAVSLNDVDLCLRIRETGQLIVMDPNVELYHFESKSRGYEDTPEKQKRFREEILRFRARWKDLLEQGDPYYSPNLSLCNGDCVPRKEGEIPPVWTQLFGDRNEDEQTEEDEETPAVEEEFPLYESSGSDESDEKAAENET